MSTLSPPATSALPHRRLRLRSLRIALLFSTGLIAVLLGVNWIMEHYLGGHRYLIGPEVYEVAMDRVHRADPRVVDLYLGDSVARQIFYPGHERDPHVCRYLTTNQAIGLAGQYYLLRDALVSFPHAREVYLLYTPRSFGNNLDGPLGLDYFCEFFHRPDEIAEVFRVKRDVSVTAAQMQRWLLPGLIAINRQATLRLQSTDAIGFTTPDRAAISSGVAELPGAAAEPVLRTGQKLIDIIWPHETYPPLPPITGPLPPEQVPMSPVSFYYLKKIRKLCQSRRVQLHILPCPCASDRPWIPGPFPYDQPIWYLPPTEFLDGIHLKFNLIDQRRREFISRYHLAGN